MAAALLLDTDVLIDYLRGLPQAVGWLEDVDSPLLLSAVTVAELYAGVRDGEERTTLEAFLGAFETIPVNREIATQGGLYRRDFLRSHGTGLADALIAATAATAQARLVTLNETHFPMLTEILVPYRKS
ncbi:MAG: type II toxin-antitoxin system VapC family toxin [Deferrisomatales bacterium]|nr:type II toxin-antitoxin system VapC family toxin [Deferrisomatales bacterium]